ncbi:MAG: hypothetical protein EHM93_19770 [Bacteroidales bacterium]|nr:MAG: hypothetical protein EHM93_19770 [Bacteroidales bacterium]
MKNIVSSQAFFSGVYIITNIKNGKRYVGSSRNIYHRLRRHLSNLRKNIHGNPKLQEDFNIYGEDIFISSIVTSTPSAELLKEEQDYIDKLNPEYNIIQDCLTNTPSMEMCAKISRTVKEKVALGLIVPPDKTRFRKKVFQFDLEGNYITSYISVEEAAKINNVFPESISAICRGDNRSKRVGNYIYSYSETINIENYRHSSHRRISVINTKSGEIYSFTKLTDCVENLHISESTLHRMLKNNNKIYRNMKIYADSKRENTESIH